MSVSTLAHPPRHGAALTKFWIGIILVIAAGVALAWWSAGALRGDTLPSGVNVRTVQAGTGPFIKPMDGVMIEYELRLPDGSLKESTEGSGPQPLIPAQTVPGFAEALSHMQQGGRYHAHIPAELAYGSTPPPGMPKNSDLEFDIHIAKVVPDAGLMAGAGAGAGPTGGEGEAQPPSGNAP
jgi:FKBP-type peptidyl-prolyl cis-trans isomerase FkpA